MPSPTQIRQGVTGMDQYRQQPPASQPVAPGPPQPGPLPTDFTGHTQHLLSGAMLQENPYFQSAVEDPTRRAAAQTFGNERARIGEMAEQGGALGGDIYQSMMGRAFRDNAQATGDTLAQARYANFGDERDRMMQALAGQGAFETANLDRESQESMAQLQAQLQRDLQSGQLDFGRQQLALEALNSLARNDLAEAQFLAGLSQQGFNQDFAMMQLGGQLGQSWGDQQLNAFGMVPGLENAGYTGYGQAFGAEGQVGQMDAHAASERARIDAMNAQNQYDWERNNDANAFNDYMRNLLGLSQVGGTSGTEGFSPGQFIPSPDPWTSGLSQGLAGFGELGGWNSFGGGASSAGQMQGYFGPGAAGYQDPSAWAQPGYDAWQGQGGYPSSNPGGGSSGGGGSSSFGSSPGGWGSNFPSGFSPIGYGPQGWGNQTTFQGQGGPNPYAGMIPFTGYDPTSNFNEPESGGPYIGNTG